MVLRQAEGGPASADAPAMADYLAWHGIKASAVTARRAQTGVGAQLLSEATAQGDLLVMGAYTHSRVRQMVFGGVTEHVLANARIPTLMAH